jgi:hypothetical protein
MEVSASDNIIGGGGSVINNDVPNQEEFEEDELEEEILGDGEDMDYGFEDPMD